MCMKVRSLVISLMHCASHISILFKKQCSNRLGNDNHRIMTADQLVVLPVWLRPRPLCEPDTFSFGWLPSRWPEIDVDALDELGYPFGCGIRHTCDNHATVAMPNQDHVGQILIPQDIEDILDMGRKVGFWRCQVAPFAEAGKRWRVDGMTRFTQKGGDTFPTPSSVPASMDKNIGCHVEILIIGNQPIDYINQATTSCSGRSRLSADSAINWIIVLI
jgi:hypothetical protein